MYITVKIVKDLIVLSSSRLVGKVGSVATAKGSAKDATTAKKPIWTKEDTMARKIQTFYRGYRSE